jgi:hypothetical protein
MASIGRTAFKGVSGKAYRFKVYALSAKFRKLSGVYVVTSRLHKKDGGYRHIPLYVGHTEDFSQPFAKHRKSAEFLQQGANCICLQKDVSEESRMAKEEDLVAGLNPACNG